MIPFHRFTQPHLGLSKGTFFLIFSCFKNSLANSFFIKLLKNVKPRLVNSLFQNPKKNFFSYFFYCETNIVPQRVGVWLGSRETSSQEKTSTGHGWE